MMTKGEHANERTYVVRDRLYIPSTTLLSEGIIIINSVKKVVRGVIVLVLCTSSGVLHFTKFREISRQTKIGKTICLPCALHLLVHLFHFSQGDASCIMWHNVSAISNTSKQ